MRIILLLKILLFLTCISYMMNVKHLANFCGGCSTTVGRGLLSQIQLTIFVSHLGPVSIAWLNDSKIRCS